jgi:hypothetical protein
MRTITKVTTVAAGVLAAGALVAIPALATGQPGGPGYGPGAGTSTAQGYGPGCGQGDGPGSGSGMRVGVRGSGAGSGDCLLLAPSGTVTDAQRSALQAGAQEEKLAHDLYTEFAARYDDPVFDQIAAAETNHLAAIRTLLTRYAITDPTADAAAGRFSDPAVQSSYNDLLAKGVVGERAALEVGRTVEQADIAQLQAGVQGLTAPDMQRVYEHLLTASTRHQTAFENRL